MLTKSQRAAQKLKVSDLYLSGVPQYEIARRLGVSVYVVSKTMEALRLDWQRLYRASFEEKLFTELARLDALETQYWSAWERSKGDKVRTRAYKRGDKDIAGERESESRDGNPSFLEGIGRCIELRLKVMGGFAATKIETHDWHLDAMEHGVDPETLVAFLTTQMETGQITKEFISHMTNGNGK